MSKPQQLLDLEWKLVPIEVERLATKAAATYSIVQDLLPSLPAIRARLWFNPDSETAFLSYPLEVDTDKVASYHIALRQVPNIEHIEHSYFADPPSDQPYIRIKSSLDNKDLFGPIASAMQMKPNALNKLWGGPNPVASSIAGGLLGAGAGWFGGWLGEKLLPEEYFEKGRLRRTSALLGGLAGTVPGLFGIADNIRTHGWSGWAKNYPSTEKVSEYTLIRSGLQQALKPYLTELDSSWLKYADEAGGSFAPMIPVDQFGRTIWNDLRSAGGFTDPSIAAATTGLISAASLSRDGANFISPMDIARISMGAGSGYLSSLLVGKTLGALAGLRPATQQKLQETGAWAGVLANTVPLAFPR